MHNQNPVHKAIYESVVKPTLAKIPKEVEAKITGVDYHAQTVDILWWDTNGNTPTYAYKVAMPKDADGVYRQSVKIGDAALVSFTAGSYDMPYISIIKKQTTIKDYENKYGKMIPKGMWYV